jgi:hypothetical protein
MEEPPANGWFFVAAIDTAEHLFVKEVVDGRRASPERSKHLQNSAAGTANAERLDLGTPSGDRFSPLRIAP